MKKNRLYNPVMGAVYGLCAAISIANCVKDYTVRTPGAVDGWNIAMAVIWSVCAVVWLFAWLGQRKRRNGDEEE